MVTVSGLCKFPIKSCRGMPVTESMVVSHGLQYDRQWVVVDASTGMFVAQRSDRGRGIAKPMMASIRTEIRGGDLVVSYGDGPDLVLPLAGVIGTARQYQLWDDRGTAVDQGDEAADWFTSWLSAQGAGNYRLVRMPDEADKQRVTAQGNGHVGFGDAYPFLVASEASLADLLGRIPEHEGPQVAMGDFRPNIVLTGLDPYAEDHMREMQIGDVVFAGQTLCVRCPMTLTEQATGLKRQGEPLTTLAKYRKGLEPTKPNGVCFGRNLTHVGSGTIHVGDTVTILS